MGQLHTGHQQVLARLISSSNFDSNYKVWHGIVLSISGEIIRSWRCRRHLTAGDRCPPAECAHRRTWQGEALAAPTDRCWSPRPLREQTPMPLPGTCSGPSLPWPLAADRTPPADPGYLSSPRHNSLSTPSQRVDAPAKLV